MAWIAGLGLFLIAAVGVGGWAGYRFASEALANWNRAASSAPPATAPQTAPPQTAAPRPIATSIAPPEPPSVSTPPAVTAPPPTPPPTTARPAPPPVTRPVETTLAQQPPRVTQPAPPPPTTAARPPEPTIAPPQFTAADARRSAEDAYKDLWSALLKGDGAAAKKYVPTAKLRTMRNERDVLSNSVGMAVSQVQVGKTQTAGDRAVIFAKATSASFKDDKGKSVPFELVARMYRENGYWKVLSQMWLVSTSPERERQDAIAWLKAPAAGDEHAAAVAALEGRGARFDADGFQSAVARGDLEQLRLFLQAGMSVRTRLRDGSSALGVALLGVQGGDASKQDMAIALIRAGADLEERTPAGMTPIMRVVAACRVRVVDALVTARARLDVKDNDDKTLLDWARRSCPNLEGPLKAAGAR